MNEKELRKLINEVTAEIIADSDNDGVSDSSELRAIANTMDSTKTDSREIQNSLDAISANEVEGKLSFNAWVESQPDGTFSSKTHVYDAWLAYTNPEEYGNVVDDEKSNIPYATEEEKELFSGNESKEFTFDKFMTDINEREDKIALHKKELTDNNGDSYARTVQRLYQEDWRNSVKLKGKK